MSITSSVNFRPTLEVETHGEGEMLSSAVRKFMFFG